MGAHEDFSRKHEIRAASDRSFGIVFAVFFALVAVWPVIHRRPIHWWAFAVSGVLLLVTLVQPCYLHPLNRTWMRLAVLFNGIVTPIIMSLLFFGIFTPIAMLFRLQGKNPLRLGFERDSKSYWLERNPPGPPPESMARQF